MLLQLSVLQMQVDVTKHRFKKVLTVALYLGIIRSMRQNIGFIDKYLVLILNFRSWVLNSCMIKNTKW